METIVAWTYIAGFSLPLLGSIFVLIRTIGSLTVSGGRAGNGPSLIKIKPLPTILVVMGFAFLILLALLLEAFFINKFAYPRYSLPAPLDIAGIVVFFLYLFGSLILFFSITGRFETAAERDANLSRVLVDMITKKVMGSSP